MSTDPRIDEPSCLAFSRQDIRAGKASPAIRGLVDIIDSQKRKLDALAAADKAATFKQFTGAEVNQAGWVCGACEPGDYSKCEDCQSACDDVAQFMNRMIRGTE